MEPWTIALEVAVVVAPWLWRRRPVIHWSSKPRARERAYIGSFTGMTAINDLIPMAYALGLLLGALGIFRRAERAEAKRKGEEKEKRDDGS